MKLILIHGAGLGTWIWDRVLPHLRTPAVAVDRGPTLDACVARVVEQIDGEAVLVGHSIGASIAMAAASQKRARVVLVGGLVPESGKNFLSLLPFPARVFLRLMLRGERIALPQSLVRKEYCNDLDAATTELVLRNVVPEVSRIYLDGVMWNDMPTGTDYVKLLDDRSAKPEQQDGIAKRVGAKRIMTMHTGHLPMLAKPREMAVVLDELAQPNRPA